MKENIRILYLKDENSKNTKFINYLKTEYKTDVFHYVLPKIYESKFGNLFFDSLSNYNDDIEWSKVLGFKYSYDDNVDNVGKINLGKLKEIMDEITYKYGLDFYYHYREQSSIVNTFKLVFLDNLKLLKSKNTHKIKIKDVLSKIKKSKIFIKEEELSKYDLIIIDKLAAMVFPKYSKKLIIDSNGNSHYDIVVPGYFKYKITPGLLNNLLNLNIKIIHLMDYKESNFNWSSRLRFKHNKILERIGMSAFSIGKEFPNDKRFYMKHFMTGIDYETHINHKLSEFEIIIDDKYEKEISNTFLSFYIGVKKLKLYYPIQLFLNNNTIDQDKNKIVLRGNKETTKLYSINYKRSLDDFENYFPDGFKHLNILTNNKKLDIDIIFKYLSSERNKINNETLLKFLMVYYNQWEKNPNLYHLLNDLNIGNGLISIALNELFPGQAQIHLMFEEFESAIRIIKNTIITETIFGIADSSQYKNSITLTGNICCDNYFTDNSISNKIFIGNIIRYLTAQTIYKSAKYVELFPKIKIDKLLGEIFINNIKIDLKKVEYCYYCFFVERAKNQDDYITVLQTDNFEYNVFIDEAKDKHILNNRISPYIIKEIIINHDKSFPFNNSNRKLKQKFKGENEDGKRIEKTTPLFKPTFLSYYSRINSSLSISLSKILTDNQLNSVMLSRKGNNDYAKYGIRLPGDNIEIIS